MNNFDDRLKYQREVIKNINKKLSLNESLTGLSSDAILRWSLANNIDNESKIICTLKAISNSLSFMANKSQAPIEPNSEIDNENLEKEISQLLVEISEMTTNSL